MLDREAKELLEENLEVSRETLRVVKKLNRAVVWGRIMRLIKWSIIIALLILGFRQIQPYLESIQASYENVGAVLDQFKNFPKNVSETLQ